MSVRLAFIAGKLLPSRAISIIRAQASKSETGSCTLTVTDLESPNGIQVNGSFVLGFDHDRPGVYEPRRDQGL